MMRCLLVTLGSLSSFKSYLQVCMGQFDGRGSVMGVIQNMSVVMTSNLYIEQACHYDGSIAYCDIDDSCSQGGGTTFVCGLSFDRSFVKKSGLLSLAEQ